MPCYARNRSMEEKVVDFRAIKFEVYKVMKLEGGASSREAHSRLYTRTWRICNIFLSYESYKEGIHPDDDGDSKVHYNDLITGHFTFQGGDRRKHIQVSIYYAIFVLKI